MTPDNAPSPPALALALLSRALPPQDRDDIVGDLTEMYGCRVQTRQPGHRLWFWAQTLIFVLGYGAAAARTGASSVFRWGNVMTSIRAAVRALRHDPGYAVAFVLTMGLGIGATTAIFSAVEGVLIRPLPYPHADRIVYAQQPIAKTGVENTAFSFVEVADYRQQTSTIEELVEYGDWQFNVVGLGEPRLAYGGLVTANYFKVLAIKPLLGRALQPQDDGRGAHPVAVLTYEFWRSVTGSDPNIL